MSKTFQKIVIAGILLILGLGLLAAKVIDLPAHDLTVFINAARHSYWNPDLLYHHNIDFFLYPPQASWLFFPFIFSPSQDFSKLVWFFCNIGIIFGIVRFSWLRLGALLLLGRYLSINLVYGQINLLILFISFLSIDSRLTKKSFFSPLLVSINSFLKIFPGLQITYWFLKKDWQKLSIYIGISSLILLIPAFIYGWNEAIVLYQELFSRLSMKSNTIYSHNQSFYAFFSRLFTDQSFKLFSVGDAKWTLIAFPEIISKIAAIGIGGWLSLKAWKKVISRDMPYDQISAYLFSFLFLSPLVWKPYFILLFPAWIQILECHRKEILKKMQFWIFFVICFFLTPDVLGFSFSTKLDAAIVHMMGALITFQLWMKIQKTKSSFS